MWSNTEIYPEKYIFQEIYSYTNILVSAYRDSQATYIYRSRFTTGYVVCVAWNILNGVWLSLTGFTEGIIRPVWKGSQLSIPFLWAMVNYLNISLFHMVYSVHLCFSKNWPIVQIFKFLTYQWINPLIRSEPSWPNTSPLRWQLNMAFWGIPNQSKNMSVVQ